MSDKDDAEPWSKSSCGQTKTLLTARICGVRSHLGTSSRDDANPPAWTVNGLRRYGPRTCLPGASYPE